jgi:hypothetical protein
MSALGTEFKLNIHLEPIEGLRMFDYDFNAEIYTNTDRRVVIPKSKMRMSDEDNYICMVESSDAIRIGRGLVMVDVVAYIPDDDFYDGLRTEKITLCSNVTIR